MPHKRERTTSRGRTSLETARAQQAVAEVIREVAKEYQMCHVTLSRYVQQKKEGNTIKVGYNPATRVFSKADEDALTSYLMKTADCFFDLTPTDVRALAYQCTKAGGLKMPQSWSDAERAGVDWFNAFLKRHPQLSIRRPQ